MGDKILFKQFLIEAKKNLNLSEGKGKIEEACRPGSKDFSFKKYNFYFYDSYIGKNDILGQQIIWKNEKPYWGMNYSGKMLIDDVPNDFNTFLKKAICEADENCPFRGPKNYEEDHYKYECIWEGDLHNFKGSEIVKLDGQVIYNLDFHGGNLS